MSWFGKKKEDKKEDQSPEVKGEDGWFSRLKSGLSRSSEKISSGITAALTHRKLDDEVLQSLEDALIASDIGPVMAGKLTADLARERFGKDITEEEVKSFLAEGIAAILAPIAEPLDIPADKKPFVILVCGVNGAGKTTTIGKLAKKFRDEGKSVMLAAGDTFRAAAVEQLSIWGERTGSPVIKKDIGADAAALAFEALQKAKAEGADILMIDTAGRLQNRADLMAELEKIVRVIKKQDDSAPHATLLVLDATTGQNAHSQVELFQKAVQVSGLIVTKLDGSAKGGVLVALAEKFGLPVYAIGVGEKVEDLRGFDARSFGYSLLGLEVP